VTTGLDDKFPAVYFFLWMIVLSRHLNQCLRHCTKRNSLPTCYRIVIICARARYARNTYRFWRCLSVPMCVRTKSQKLLKQNWCSVVGICPTVNARVVRHFTGRYCVTAASSVGSTEHTGGPTLQINHIRPSSIFCCGSHSVEQSSCRI